MSADAACPIVANATLAGVLVRNLVDNAIRYSPPHASVKLSVVRDGGRVVLRVEDSGPGMAAADADRLGERFFRVLGTGEGGSGLGWSIVRRIAEVHQAAVSVDRSDDLGGLRVEVAWPAAQ